MIYIVMAFVMWAMWFSSCSSKRSEVFRIGRDPTWYPLELVNKTRNVQAFADELLVEIGRRQNFKVALLRTTFDTLRMSIDHGDFDAVMTSIQPDSSLRGRYRFSRPFFFTGPTLVVPFGSTANSLSEMGSKRVGISPEAQQTYKIDSGPTVLFRYYDNIVVAMEAMLRGDLDGVIMDLVPAYGFERGIYRGQIRIAGDPLTRLGMRVIGAKGGVAEELIDRFDQGLRDLRDDGTYGKLLDKWGLTNPQEFQ